MLWPGREHIVEQHFDVTWPFFDPGKSAVVAIIVASMGDCRDHEPRFDQRQRGVEMAFEGAAAAVRHDDEGKPCPAIAPPVATVCS